ncbi:MAG: translocation/assembly module TamB [Aliivibrio sp.]|uniref:autotransporter assembly complex protein TamB n=1 Tax=Aliivibrio sp. TaxID=1872443 RepID=UPI001A3D12C0|nr:translocation/assembly module TamB [Aliivibrio sp.]
MSLIVAKKWGSRCGVAIVAVVISLLLLISMLLLTNPGLNTLLWGVKKALPELSVEQTSGALVPDFTLSGLSFSDGDNVDITVKRFRLAITPSCLFNPELCIDAVELDGVVFSLPTLPDSAAPQQKTTNSKPLTAVETPIPVQINHIALNDIELNILGNTVSWQHFSTGLSMRGNRLLVSPVNWQSVTLQLAPKTGDDELESVTKVDHSPSVIELPEVLIPLEVELTSFSLHDFILKQAEPIKVTSLAFSGKAKEHQVSLHDLRLDMPQLSLELNSKISLVGDYPLELQATATVKESELKGHNISLQATGSVAQLALSAQLDGTLKASLDGKLQPLQPTFPFELNIHDGDLRWPLNSTPDYQLQLSKLSSRGDLDGYQFNLQADLQGIDIPELQLDVKAEGDLEQISISDIVVETLGGEIAGQVMVNWQQPLNWQSDLTLSRIKPGLQWPKVEGVLNGDIKTLGSLTEQGGWQVSIPLLDIQGMIRDYPLDLHGSLVASDELGQGEFQVQIDDLALKHGSNSIQLNGQLDQSWAMKATINIPELSATVPDLQGQAVGDISLSGSFEAPNINLDLAIMSLNWKNEAKLEQLTVKGNLSPWPLLSGHIEVAAKGGEYQKERLDTLTLLFKGSEKDHQLSINAQTNPLSLAVLFNGEFNRKTGWQGALSQAEINTEMGPWGLNRPASINYNLNDHAVTVGAHCWGQKEASICLDQDLKMGERGEASVTVQRYRLNSLKPFMPDEMEVEAELNATAWAKWAPNSSPQLKANVDISAGSLQQQMDEILSVAWNQISLNAEIKQDKLNIDWLLDFKDNGRVFGDVNIFPIDKKDKSIDGELTVEAISLAFLQPALGEYSTLKAEMNSAVTITGPINQPKLNGNLTIENIVVKGEVSPVDINNGDIALDFSGYNAILNSAINTPDGDLTVTGDADWADISAWRVGVKVSGDELKVNLPPVVKLNVHPDLNVSITPKLAIIEGDITIPWGRIVVEKLPESAVSLSKDEVMLNEDLQPLQAENSFPMQIKTDINITIGDDVQLAAFGLEGNLIGKLNVTQQDKGPFIIGEINIKEGTYRSFGQDLIINKGKILFNGPADQPYVAIEAIRNPENTQDDVIAGIRVNGAADEPQVEIFSEPSMAQSNALSYLLRGQDIGGEGGGDVMTTTLIGLSLAKSGKVVGEIGNAFGVQDLALDTAGSGDDSQVTVSGHITPELQVKYGVGIFNSLGEFTVRYRLFTGLYLEAISGLDSAVDLLYQFEFN